MTLPDSFAPGASPLPVAKILALLQDILPELAALHRAGGMHGAITPEAIDIDTQGKAWLRPAPENPELADPMRPLRAGLAGGYAALEQYLDDPEHPVGPWTDVHAICAVACAWITGGPPPEAPSRLVQDAWIPLMQRSLSDFPPALLQAVDEGLALWPADRAQSVDGLLVAMGGEAAPVDVAPALAVPSPRIDAVPADPASAFAEPAAAGSTGAGAKGNGEQGVLAAEQLARAEQGALDGPAGHDQPARSAFDDRPSPTSAAGVLDHADQSHAVPTAGRVPQQVPARQDRAPWALIVLTLAALVGGAWWLFASPSGDGAGPQGSDGETVVAASSSAGPAGSGGGEETAGDAAGVSAAPAGTPSLDETAPGNPPAGAGSAATAATPGEATALSQPAESLGPGASEAVGASEDAPAGGSAAAQPDATPEYSPLDALAPGLLSTASSEAGTGAGTGTAAAPDTGTGTATDTAPADGSMSAAADEADSTPDGETATDTGEDAEPPPPAMVSVSVDIRPWGEILIDGQPRGVSPPLKQLRLAPGTYTVTIRNADLPPRRIRLTVQAGRPASISHAF